MSWLAHRYDYKAASDAAVARFAELSLEAEEGGVIVPLLRQGSGGGSGGGDGGGDGGGNGGAAAGGES